MKKLTIEAINQHIIDRNKDTIEIELDNDFPTHIFHYKNKYWIVSSLLQLTEAFDSHGRCDALIESLSFIFNTIIATEDFLAADAENNLILQRLFDSSIDIKKSPDAVADAVSQHESCAQHLYNILKIEQQDKGNLKRTNKVKVFMP